MAYRTLILLFAILLAIGGFSNVFGTCGDVNNHDGINLGDVSCILSYIVLNTPTPTPISDANVDNTCSINIADVVYLSNYICWGGPAPSCTDTLACSYMTQTGYSVRIGSPLYDAYPGSDSIAVPIYITNATELYGLSLGFHYNSDDIEVTSIDFTGGVIPNLNRVFAIRPTDNDVVIAWSLWCSGLSVQTDALLGTLNVQILAGETNQEIPLDSAFVSPGVDFMFVTSAGASIRPELEYPTGLPSFTFTDIAAAAGVDMPTNWADVQFVDYNGDNLLDIYQHGTLLRNNGDSTFSDVTGSSGIDASDYLSGAWADYDNDGHIDAAISKNGETNSIRLYHNDGDGTFTNVTASAQINMPGRKVNWVDYDNDGFVDLFSSYDPGGVPNGVMSLWKNNGDGTFTDVTVDAGLDSSIDVSASSFFDHNNDSYQDLVVSAFWNTSRIFENNGDGTFTDKTGEYGLGVRPSQGITSGDFNFDGWLDFFVGVYYDTYSRLYRNDAGSGFTDVTVDFNAIGPTGDVIRVVNFADFNNDSYLDIYESNYNSGDPSILFLYDSDLNEFYRAENSAGVANTSSHKASHAIGDFDNDGDLDILAEGQSGDANRLYSNNLYPGNSTRHWIGFRLTGIMSNRSAIGARVMVYCDSVLMREINTGGGWSQNQLWPHFGIGEQTAVDSVRILWPSGEVDRLLNPAIDQYHSINEGSYAHRAWHVATTGSDLTGDGSAGNPYETIQHAIDQSADGDTVLVHDGTYDGVGNREIDFSGKQIIVQSENGPEVTIIESKTNPFTYELIYFQNDEDTLTQLQGFTIRYGKRGIRIDGASPKIVDCNITVNIGLFSDGNGVYITNGSPHFLHCEFDTNGCFDPAYGAAITCNTGDPVFDSCLFIGNGASVSDATGAMAFYNSSPVLRNCTFSHNSNPGSNIFKANQSDINMVNCILAYSDSDDDAVVCYSGGTVNLSCCNIYGNTGGDYVGCLVGQEGINGNTSADPLFCNTANSDFHIKYGSPCAPVNNSCHELIGALNYGGAVVVDNLDNDGRGSLRWAIDSANTNAGCDTILFTMEGAVALTSSLPTVTDNETVILGNSAPGGDGSVVLDGSGFGKTLNSGIVLNSSDNVISGLTIAGFAGNGIEITGAGSVNNTITNILIYDNGGLGIDLNDDGVTANDAGDTDTGANELLNYPEFDSVVFTPDTTFMLYGHALANALIDLYVAHPGGDTLEPEDGSGHGEAYSYVGRDTADAGGDFVHEIGTAFSQFSKITATATDHHGNTSEFSENVTLTPAPLIIVGYSPINLQIFDPAGDSIGKTPDGIFFTSIVPASYTEITNDSVHIDYPLPGDYEIIVVPENDAPPGGVYSIGIRLDGSLQCIIIEDAEVPADGQADTLGYEVVENFHYLNGDATRDDTINLLDILHLISYIYGQPPGPAPYPEGSGDANCDQVLNLLDILYLIDNLYGTPLGPPPCDLSR